MTEATMFQAMFAAPLIAASKRHPRTLHAVTMKEVICAWGRGEATSVCGEKGLNLLANEDKSLLLEWPPAIRGLAPSVRCQECWEQTGKMRPRTTTEKARASDWHKRQTFAYTEEEIDERHDEGGRE
jgi:hypothetical protein